MPGITATDKTKNIFPKTSFKTPDSIPTCTAEVREAVSLECSIARRLRFVLHEIYLLSSCVVLTSSLPFVSVLSDFTGIQCIIWDKDTHKSSSLNTTTLGLPKIAVIKPTHSLQNGGELYQL